MGSPTGGGVRWESKNYAMSPNFLYILHNFTGKWRI